MRVGQNRLMSMFLDPAEKAFYVDWEKSIATFVASFLQKVVAETDDPRFVEMVGELSLSSDHFRRLWARQDIYPRIEVPTRMRHPCGSAATARSMSRASATRTRKSWRHTSTSGGLHRP
jgi:MmyB-like transcription regulator ligand binding domain